MKAVPTVTADIHLEKSAEQSRRPKLVLDSQCQAERPRAQSLSRLPPEHVKILHPQLQLHPPPRSHNNVRRYSSPHRPRNLSLLVLSHRPQPLANSPNARNPARQHVKVHHRPHQHSATTPRFREICRSYPTTCQSARRPPTRSLASANQHRNAKDAGSVPATPRTIVSAI